MLFFCVQYSKKYMCIHINKCSKLRLKKLHIYVCMYIKLERTYCRKFFFNCQLTWNAQKGQVSTIICWWCTDVKQQHTHFFFNCSIARNCTLAPSAVNFFVFTWPHRHFNFRFWFPAMALKFLQWNMSNATPISFSGYVCRRNSKYWVKVPSDVTI